MDAVLIRRGKGEEEKNLRSPTCASILPERRNGIEAVAQILGCVFLEGQHQQSQLAFSLSSAAAVG